MERMEAWKTPPITTLMTSVTGGRGSLVPAGGHNVLERRRREPDGPACSDLPAGDPLEELRARRLHRLPGRHDLEGIDGDEVVAVLVRGDALIEVAHLHVVLAPAPLPGERLHLDALQGLHHVRLRR